jgi:murein DD-endopeptidase MepM/ murein hydrolase activator NlpD
MRQRCLTSLMVLVLVVGCSSTPSSAPVSLPNATPTIAATSTPAPSATPTATATPQPSPTLTPSATATATPEPTATPVAITPAQFGYPIGWAGQPPGEGFFIRHGTPTENTWYNPGYWHTGEDWYAQEGDTAGAEVYAIGEGQVVYAGGNYPGRVVIVQHAEALFSMYGHLDPALRVQEGQRVVRGELLGTVLQRSDSTPNHLHFEIRTFLTTGVVNGNAPRYPFRCGPNCPPGPGYWPINAPDLPSDVGWRNPTHIINRLLLPGGAVGEVVVATQPISQSAQLWTGGPNDNARQPLAIIELLPGERWLLYSIATAPDDSRTTSALSYELWYEIGRPDEPRGWVQAAIPSTFETGSDGRPSSVYLLFVPAPNE